MSAELQERRPRDQSWRRISAAALARDPLVEAVSAWQLGRVSVVSTLVHAELPDRSGIGLQWHLSVARQPGPVRPRPLDVRRTLRAFGMVGAEEDNHHPGNARHFFLVVDPAHRVTCECKADEATIVEPDGYRWQNTRDEDECRGCEAEFFTARPCPIHGADQGAAA